ncbi:MAG: hypothetical protein NC548_55200 [Lachnospiraceae bacterium]|nr:hypothetical protein [Lachnospiraceae bacterium]
MKKIFFAIFSISVFSAFAELYPSRRYVEIGAGAGFRFSENLASVSDVMKKELIIDLDEIYSNMKKGFILTAGATPEAYMDFNFKNFGFGFHAGVDVSGRMNISRDFFGILANGIEAGKKTSVDMNLWLQSFAEASVPVYFKIFDFRVKVTPTYFVPLVYIPDVSARASLVNKSDGTIEAKVDAPISIYTAQKFGDSFDGSIDSIFAETNISSMISDSLKNGGFDLGVLVEYPFTRKLDLGAYANIPIVPGRLKGKLSTFITASIKTPSLIDMIADGEDAGETEVDYEVGDFVYTEDKYYVNRPMRFGAEIAYRPWKNWLTLRARAGLAFRNPFGKDFNIRSFYPEYDLGAEFVLFYVLGLSLHTEYTQQVFAHTLQLILNARVFELDISAGICNSDFLKSFQIQGACAAVAVKFGF